MVESPSPPHQAAASHSDHDVSMITLEEERNARRATIDGKFTVCDARVKLKQRYPMVKTQPD